MSQSNEAEYINALEKRENWAYARLFDQCRRDAAYLTKSAWDQDELAQLTVVRIMENFDRFDKSRSLRTWSITIQRRIWYGLNQKRRIMNFTDLLTWIHADGDPGDWLPDPKSRTPDSILGTREDLDYIAHGENTINPEERGVIMTRHGYSRENGIRETAIALDIPEGTVKSDEHRARTKLKEKIRLN